MGRKKKRPTKVVSTRVAKTTYKKLKKKADKSGKSVSQMWRDIIKEGK